MQSLVIFAIAGICAALAIACGVAAAYCEPDAIDASDHAAQPGPDVIAGISAVSIGGTEPAA